MRYLLGLIFFSFLLLMVSTFFSPIRAQDSKSIKARFIENEIIVDGILDDKVWNTAMEGGDFMQFFPTDSLLANYPTNFKIVYSSTTLYVALKAFTQTNKPVVSSLKRDFKALTNDSVTLLFDTFSDGTTGFFFGVTPYGVRREGLVSDGGQVFNNTWDNKWIVETQQYDDHFTAEIAIPFSSLKFVEGATQWRFRPYRWNIQSNEQSSWVRVPQNQRLSSFAFMGTLFFEKPLGKSKAPIALIPYSNILWDSDFQKKENKASMLVGGDAKLAIGNGMNLDLTLNPDFSNVEVDDVFTNLTRFELQLPEKRQFFIDNSDLFENYGNTFEEAKPFFSRRIGLAKNKNDDLIQNDIIGGLRLSGKINEDWRLGLLNIQTANDPTNEIASNNNMMLALQRKVGKRSSLSAFWVNRESFGNETFLEENDSYNRVMGLEYNLASVDNKLTGRFYAHKSFQPYDHEGNFSTQANLFYNLREWVFIGDITFVDQDFRADLGFVPRTDIFKTGQGVKRIFYPKKGIFNTHELMAVVVNVWKPTLDYQKTEHFYRLSLETEFKNRATAFAYLINNHVYLNAPFNPSGKSEAEPLPKGQEFYFTSLKLNFQSNRAQLFTYDLDSTLGQFYNGSIRSFGAAVQYRIQPWVNFGLSLKYDGLRLPKPYSDADILLMTLKTEATFSKKLFWNTLIQFSNQQDNLGINSRLQWRFAPLSDLYLVYNDNYFTQNDLRPKFRSINLKLTYWFNW